MSLINPLHQDVGSFIRARKRKSSNIATNNKTNKLNLYNINNPLFWQNKLK